MSPTIQSPAPVFSEVSLGDYLGQWVILMFYPLYAPISTDSEYLHHAWAQQARSAGGLGPDLRIPLLADRNMRVAREYGCLIEDKGITFRASYLIDPKGILRYGSLPTWGWRQLTITMNDLPVGRSVDEALRLVQAFQFTVNAHGEVCPANWKEGSKTIRADPLAKLDTLPPPPMERTRMARRTGPSVRVWTLSKR
ncbi:thioredoxin-like protein [Lactarius akahatsu]|uniref:Thioredoxin-like protein n=1 Tax=Lactarius akahatsu TaxID=416441 RepID=A0AAD4LLE8_9AGAM|nr:thioredoxin-like protein [Lactarius akahatsu]